MLDYFFVAGETASALLLLYGGYLAVFSGVTWRALGAGGEGAGDHLRSRPAQPG